MTRPLSPTLMQNANDILSGADKQSQAQRSEFRSIAASSKKNYSQAVKEASVYSRSRHSTSQLPPDPRMHHNHDLYSQSKAGQDRPMHLVPCRWQKNGWKYVEADPQEHQFFKNPNRINSHGFSPDQKQKVLQRWQPMGEPANYEDDRFMCSSYQAQFKDQKQGSVNLKNTIASAKVASIDPHGGLQWAGGYHQRKTFNKKKDGMVDWTEVMFRN